MTRENRRLVACWIVAGIVGDVAARLVAACVVIPGWTPYEVWLAADAVLGFACGYAAGPLLGDGDSPARPPRNPTRIDRLRCLRRGHDWLGDGWGPWLPGGRAAYYRERHCGRCGTHEAEHDR